MHHFKQTNAFLQVCLSALSEEGAQWRYFSIKINKAVVSYT